MHFGMVHDEIKIIASSKPSSTLLLECTYCGKKYRTRCNLRQHTSKRHQMSTIRNDHTTASSSENPNNISNIITVTICDDEASSENLSIQNHSDDDDSIDINDDMMLFEDIKKDTDDQEDQPSPMLAKMPKVEKILEKQDGGAADNNMVSQSFGQSLNQICMANLPSTSSSNNTSEDSPCTAEETETNPSKSNSLTKRLESVFNDRKKLRNKIYTYQKKKEEYEQEILRLKSEVKILDDNISEAKLEEKEFEFFLQKFQ